MKERNNVIDIAKGIGIFLIIIGHCVYFGGLVHNWIFAFHVPLFFILSGLFFKKADFLTLAKKKSKSLILPYVAFCLLGLSIAISVPALRNHLTLRGILADIYLGVPDNIHVSSVWFLMCLFFTTLILNTLLYIKQRYVSSFLFVCIIVLGFSFGSFPKLLSIFPAHRLPLDIDCAFVALLFLWLGFFFKNKILNSISILEHKSLSWLGIACCVVFTLSVILTLLNKRVNLHGMTYNNWILYVFEAIVGSILVILLSIAISRLTKGADQGTDYGTHYPSIQFAQKTFTWMGQNSLKIMGTQAIVVRAFIFLANKITGQHFSLYLLPTWYALIDCFFSVIVTVLIVAIFNCVTNLISKNFS